jgi:hypothetical protein
MLLPVGRIANNATYHLLLGVFLFVVQLKDLLVVRECRQALAVGMAYGQAGYACWQQDGPNSGDR